MGITVGEVMTRPVLAITEKAVVKDVAAHLVRAGISGVPVTDRHGRIGGIVTEHDIVNAVVEGKDLGTLTAAQIMQTDTITLDVGADLGEALQIFRDQRIIRVPITDSGRLVGILSRTDALRVLVEQPEFLIF